jgi:hypothetical protein
MINAKKIVIDVNGLLSIQRKHDAKPHPVVCPFRQGHHYCGEWCPHFPDVTSGEKYETGEPEFNLDLECGDFTAITAPEFVRMNDTSTDHLAEIRGIMEPPQASFKERLHQVEMRMYPDK